ncbi:MAG: DUF5317 family protein [Acidimicrobiales bacterium]
MFKNRVMAWPLLAAGIVLQTIGESFDVPGRPFVVTLGLLCLIGCAMRNIHIPGTAVAGIGVTLNMAVLVVNGHIPVSFDALTAFGNDVTINPAATGLWQIETDDTSLSFLGDIVPTPVLHPDLVRRPHHARRTHGDRHECGAQGPGPRHRPRRPVRRRPNGE